MTAAPVITKDRISDVLINGNPYAHVNLYDGLVKKDCYLIVGQNFIPMDMRLCQFRKEYRVKKTMKNVAITFGSSKMGIMNFAYKVCRAVVFSNLCVNVIVLNGSKLKNKFSGTVAEGLKSKLKLLPFVDNIGSVFSKADIVISSASTTCWQLAAIGVPFIVFQTASNQSLAFEYVRRTKIGIALDCDLISNGGLEREILRLNRSKREFYSGKSRKNIDCRGSERIASE